MVAKQLLYWPKNIYYEEDTGFIVYVSIVEQCDRHHVFNWLMFSIPSPFNL